MKRFLIPALLVLLIGTTTVLADETKTTPPQTTQSPSKTTTDTTTTTTDTKKATDTKAAVDPNANSASNQPKTTDTRQDNSKQENKYELGSIRVLVYEQAKKPADRAEVYINNDKKGNAPVFSEGLKPGDYNIRVVGPKANWSGTVTVQPGKTEGVDITLDKNKASANIYEVLLWEDFLDNRNNWNLQPGSTIANGSLVAKTSKSLDFFSETNHVFQDFSVEANFRIKQQTPIQIIPGYGSDDNLPSASFGFVLRAKGTATILLFESTGGTIQRYYVATFDDLDYYSQPIVFANDLRIPIKDEFRVKAVLHQEELQIFIDGKLAAISQVKYTNEGNIGLAIGPGLKIEVDNLTVGKV